jgi:hypothetical protein
VESVAKRFIQSSTLILGNAILAQKMIRRLAELGEERRRIQAEARAREEKEKLISG